jgi:hypothetical protein
LSSEHCWKLGMIVAELITNAAMFQFGLAYRLTKGSHVFRGVNRRDLRRHLKGTMDACVAVKTIKHPRQGAFDLLAIRAGGRQGNDADGRCEFVIDTVRYFPDQKLVIDKFFN